MKKIIKKILIISLFSIVIILLSCKSDYESYYESYNFDINSVDLYNETNTYKYILETADPLTENYNFNNDSRYNLDQNNKTMSVDDGEPLITVLTHGMGGKAFHWSNSGKDEFGWSNDSLISKLAYSTDSNIYWVIFGRNNSFDIYDITLEVYSKTYSKTNKIDTISDISKHSIVVFEANEGLSVNSNDNIYTQFNYVISRIVYDIKCLNNGLLPRINLIGHSRGGLINMQYALDHPDLVASIYSLGTPYTGSTTAQLLENIAPGKAGDPTAINDILNENVYSKYMTRWNNGYDDYYSNIDVTAFAGRYSIDLLIKNFKDDSLYSYINVDDTLKNKLKEVAPIALLLINNELLLNKKLDTVAMNSVSELFADFDLNGFSIDDIIQELLKEFETIPFLVLNNDICVDVGSALGYQESSSLDGQSYKGFTRITKTFSVLNCNTEVKSINAKPPVVHNLLARDAELNNNILSTIKLGYKDKDYPEKQYLSSVIKVNEICINQYIGHSIDVLYIPSYIDGKKVTKIGDYAFSNDCYGKNIKKIVIPDTVEYIGKNAFYSNNDINDQSLTEIEISPSSNLKIIESGAFWGLKRIDKLCIPDSVIRINDDAFRYSSITNFEINNNSNYKWENGLLINENVTGETNCIAIYANPTLSSIVVPNNVGILDSNLFRDNQRIESINMANVKYIGDYTFYNSSINYITNANNVEDIGLFSLSYTPWIQKQNSNYIKIGTTLIYYNGTEENVVIPEGITRISPYCFNSTIIKTVVTPSTLTSIGKDAFTSCQQLEWILLTANRVVIAENEICNKNVKIYVVGGRINDYRKSIYYWDKLDQLDLKKVKVTFYDVDGNEVCCTNEVYGTIFDLYYTAEEIYGKDFKYYYSNDGIKYKKYDYFNSYYDIELYPYYETS